MRVLSEVLTFLAFLASQSLSIALMSGVSEGRVTETIEGVPVTKNADGTEPSSGIYIFEVNNIRDAGENACASLVSSGVHEENCTYLEHVKIGYFKASHGMYIVENALTYGDLKLYVISIESDQEIRAIGVSDPAESWGLDYTDGSYPDQKYMYDDADDASDVVVAIIDTGIFFDHEQFADVKRYPGVSFVKEDQNIYTDPNGHGTHCAGTAVGNTVGVGQGLVNIHLAAVKVLGENGSGSTAGVIAGVDWVAGEADVNPNTDFIASMSLGGIFSNALNSAVNSLANRLNADVVAAAGNDSLDACLFSPASAENAVTVGSMTTIETRSYFSNFGSCVDVYAPGSGIYSSINTGVSDYATLSGTSMAAPHVAGAIAIAKVKDMEIKDIFKYDCILAIPNVCLTTCSTIPGAKCEN